MEYRYTVNHIKEAEFKAEEVLSEQDATTRVVNNRHGVRIVFRQVRGAGEWQQTNEREERRGRRDRALRSDCFTLFHLCPLQLGEIGIFDIQTLLINLVTAMGLLAAATTAVDMTMQYVLPQV